jgi:hypothetical protein
MLCAERHWAALLLIAISACTDFGPHVLQPEDDTRPVRSATLSTEHSEPELVERASLEIRIHGTLKPGKPINITAIARGQVATDNAHLRILLPEIEAARHSGWDAAYRVPVGAQIPAFRQWRGRIREGAEVTLRGSIVVPAPGFYRVIVALNAETEPTYTPDGRIIASVSSKEVWLLVDETAGQVHERFDPMLQPANSAKGPGPFRFAPLGSSTPWVGTTGYRQMAGNTVTFSQIQGRVTYTNSASGMSEPVDQARIEVRVRDWFTYGEVAYYIRTTDAQGFFSVPCFSGQYFGEVQILGHGGDVLMSPMLLGEGTLFSSHCSGTASLPVWADAEAHMYIQMRHTVTASRAFFGITRPVIQVRVQPIEWAVGYYTEWNDMITIRPLWGTDAALISSHEYGHALQASSFGGISVGYVNSPNYFNESTLPTALVEGFAEYHAIASRGHDFPGYTQQFETAVFSADGKNGAIVPYQVAAFLYDLTDPANEPHDTVHFPGSYLSQVFQSCRWHHSSYGWKIVNGIDQLIWCFEKGVDGAAASTHFSVRLTDATYPVHATAYSQTSIQPGGWSQVAVRTVWRKNLFNQ